MNEVISMLDQKSMFFIKNLEIILENLSNVDILYKTGIHFESLAKYFIEIIINHNNFDI